MPELAAGIHDHALIGGHFVQEADRAFLRLAFSAAPGTQPNAEAEAKNLASITGQSVEQIHQAAVVVDGTALSADRPANELIGICNQPRSNVPDLIADFSGTFAMERAAA